MHLIIGSLIAGAFAGEGARKLSWRPVLRAGIRESIRAQRGVVAFGEKVRAEAKQLVAEAKDELDRPDRQPDSTP